MSKIIYNKLIRDNIPEIIEKTNKPFQTHILNEQEYITYLKEKLFEETKEVEEASTKEDMIGELADVLEIVDALASQYEITPKELQEKKDKKAAKNGKFDKKLFLEYVIEPDE